MLDKKQLEILRQAADIQKSLSARIGDTGFWRQLAQQSEMVSKLLGPQRDAAKLLASLQPHQKFLADLNRVNSWHRDIQKLAGEVDRYRAAAMALGDPLEKYRKLLDVTLVGWFKDTRWQELAKRQLFLNACRKHGWVPHPLLFKWLDGSMADDTTEMVLKSKWDAIASDLTGQRTPTVMTTHRSECARQLLAAQGSGLHLLVCRTTYPEIEALAREHALKDPSFAAQLETLPPKQKGNELA